MPVKTSSPTAARTTPQPSSPSALGAGLSWWQAALLGAVAATILNVVIWSVARLAGAELALPDEGVPYPITLDSVAVMSAVPMIVGIALAALIARWWTGVFRVAQVAGALLAVVTVGGVLDGAAGTVVALTSMHLVSGAVVVLALEGTRRRALARQHAP